MPIENWRPPDFLSEAQVKKTAKSSKAIRADNLCQQDSVFAARDRFLEEPGLMSAIVSVPGFQSGFGSPFLPCISAPSNWSPLIHYRYVHHPYYRNYRAGQTRPLRPLVGYVRQSTAGGTAEIPTAFAHVNPQFPVYKKSATRLR
jgi:hypothetical protein